MQNLNEYDKPIPIILGSYVNGLGLIRSFGIVNIPTICLDSKKDIAFHSKYTKGILCPNPTENEEQFIRFLIELGKTLPQRGMLFTTNDIWLVPISKNREVLSQYFIFPMSDWNIIQNCWNKKYLYEIAKKNGIPIPKTFFLDGIEKIDAILDQINYPFVIKPIITIGFLEKLKSKGRTIVVENLRELDYWKNKIVQAEMDNVPLIIQEQIIGPTTNLYTITSYSDKNANIFAYSIGHKIRQTPPDAGVIISGRVKNDMEVYTLGMKLIRALEFYGIANTEFKKDESDNKFKLIEINPRPGMWNYSVLMSGINLPYIAYQDALGERINSNIVSIEGKVWLMLLEDFLSSVVFFKRQGYSDYSLSIKEWLSSVKGKKIYAIESWNDPLPGLVHIFVFLKGLLSSLKRK